MTLKLGFIFTLAFSLLIPNLMVTVGSSEVLSIANPCTAMILWQPPLTNFTTDSRLTEDAASSTTTGASQMDLTENETEADSQPSGVDIASASSKWTENSVSDDDMDL
ncbi:hypothetical protein HOLleu_10928 [Holothuria leucospilota]|uniref:Secreted protein n=1 Tax=Holothuria leucospilota TaxID=206669 RepID=A0A9Q1CEN3_HOLLE|nr:hypothetical protein HOLleu_10928 [Holothuria leucospilota]